MPEGRRQSIHRDLRFGPLAQLTGGAAAADEKSFLSVVECDEALTRTGFAGEAVDAAQRFQRLLPVKQVHGRHSPSGLSTSGIHLLIGQDSLSKFSQYLQLKNSKTYYIERGNAPEGRR